LKDITGRIEIFGDVEEILEVQEETPV